MKRVLLFFLPAQVALIWMVHAAPDSAASWMLAGLSITLSAVWGGTRP